MSRFLALGFIPLPSQPGCEFEEGAEQGGAIVVRRLDQARLLDKTAD